jgi:hypothetical protein
MKALILPATGFELSVPDNFHYHNDGVVPSLDKHTSELCRKYDNRNPYSIAERLNQRAGEFLLKHPMLGRLRRNFGIYVTHGRTYCVWSPGHSSLDEALKAGGEVHCSTYVLESDSDEAMVFYKGHEEGHVVLATGNEDLILSRVKSLGVRNAGYFDLPLELKCEVVGLCALRRRFPLPQILNVKTRSIVAERFVDYLKQNREWKIELIGGRK